MGRMMVQSLGEHFDSFVERHLEAGDYETPEDVIRAGLRLLERRERKLKALRAALQEGLDSGEPVEFDLEAFLASKRKSLGVD